MGGFAKDYFGCSTDFSRDLTSDYFYSVNFQWLDVFHVDGFRYDCVPNYYQGPASHGYAELVYNTYNLVKQRAGTNSHWQRLLNNNSINFIQCAEQLEYPIGILYDTYTNCTWQNTMFGIASSMAANYNPGQLENFALNGLGLEGYPKEVVHNQIDIMQKTAFQYLENHDHSRFICNFDRNLNSYDLFQQGNRGNYWFKLQPYLIALFTCKGIPMLWQGEEFCENYFVPEGGMGRVRIGRPVRWDYFYDETGRSIISLIRELIQLRKNNIQFKQGEYKFYNDYYSYQSKNILVFHRLYNQNFSLVALNFSDIDQQINIKFLLSGNYKEELHGQQNLTDIKSDQDNSLWIPSNYGRIWTFV